MNTPKIIIKQIELQGNTIQTSISIAGENQTIATSLNNECLPYLCLDRIDAYVIGFLYFALKQGYNIESHLPISEELYYNLEYHFIDAICMGNPHLHRIKIKAPTINGIQDLSQKTLVATGISCGIDSLYTIATHSTADIPKSFKLNTLCFFNAGAAAKGEKEIHTPLVQGRLEQAMNFAKEYCYKFLYIESNIHLVIQKYIPYSHIENSTYTLLHCIFLLQNGIKKYYISSSDPYTDFNLTHTQSNKEKYASDYDLLTCMMSSINGISIYSTGANTKRIEKTRYLANNYPPTYKYLNVCVNTVENDTTCFKCIRTLLSIDAVGDINRFNKVFNLNIYKQNKLQYIRRMWINAKLKNDDNYFDILPYYKHILTPPFKCKILLSIILNKIKRKKL